MKAKVRFLYFYKKVKQLSLSSDLPDLILKMEVGEGHMIMGKSALCRLNIDIEKFSLAADGRFTTTKRRDWVPLCKKCQDRYKELPGGDWEKWVKE